MLCGVNMLLALAAVTLAANHAAANEACELTIQTAKKDAVYKTGETVTFVVSLKHDGNKPSQDVEVDWTISKDGLPPKQTGKSTLKNGQLRLTGKLDEPGFLQCEIVIPAGAAPCGNTKPITALAGAAVSPEQIKPSMPAPADFEAYWSSQLQALRKQAPRITLTRVEADNPEYSDLIIYDLQASAPEGVHVSGYLAIPKDAKARSLPALLSVHGAGVRSSSLQGVVNFAKQGMIAMDVNAHGIPNGQPKEFYDELSNGKLRNYPRRIPASREESYFRTMFLRVVCAIDILCDRPEWDGKTLITYGTSQGGAQALAGAALDKRVSLAVAGVPAMCDMTGMVAKRQTGWPRAAGVDKDGKRDTKTLEIMRYYDMMNFAPQIRVPVAVTVGFIDKTCAPTSVYAAYNNLGGAKTIFNDLPTGHTNTREARRFMNNAIQQHIKEQAAK